MSDNEEEHRLKAQQQRVQNNEIIQKREQEDFEQDLARERYNIVRRHSRSEFAKIERDDRLSHIIIYSIIIISTIILAYSASLLYIPLGVLVFIFVQAWVESSQRDKQEELVQKKLREIDKPELFYHVDLATKKTDNKIEINDVFGNIIAEIHATDLSQADLQYLDLENADFRNQDLSCADLYGANLTNADFCGADLEYATFNRAQLNKAIYDVTTILPKPPQQYTCAHFSDD